MTKMATIWPPFLLIFLSNYDIMFSTRKMVFAVFFYLPTMKRVGFFVITKGSSMKKITFIGDGKTKDFYFSFPYFTKKDVVVELNGAPTTGFGLFYIF